MKKITAFILMQFLIISYVQADTYVAAQKNKSFSVSKLKIKVGDTVRFPNQDPFFHNVYSLSEAKSFELGSYPNGESREIVFEEAGEVVVECAIHQKMYLLITVEP